jgi:hypothetical protein
VSERLDEHLPAQGTEDVAHGESGGDGQNPADVDGGKIVQEFVNQAALIGRDAVEAALFLKSGILAAEHEPHNGDPDAEKEEELEDFFCHYVTVVISSFRHFVIGVIVVIRHWGYSSLGLFVIVVIA